MSDSTNQSRNPQKLVHEINIALNVIRFKRYGAKTNKKKQVFISLLRPDSTFTQTFFAFTLNKSGIPENFFITVIE